MSKIITRDFKVTEVRASEGSTSAHLSAEDGNYGFIGMNIDPDDAPGMFALGRILTVQITEAQK